jgi:cephalosporin hydroxylase
MINNIRILFIDDICNIKNMSLHNLINDKTTDKNTVHSYLDTYESLFSAKKFDSMNVLEIGIYNGGSIKLWCDYFVNSKVYGVDIISEYDDLISEKSILYDPRIKLYTRTNAYDINFVNHLSKEKFDILIDDGPHSYESVEFFLKYYLPLLRENGILVIEDIQNWDWIDRLKQHVPEQYKEFIKVFDLRHNKGRYDDILFVIDLTK